MQSPQADSRFPSAFSWLPWVGLFGAAGLVLLLYWSSLEGPLLLDSTKLWTLQERWQEHGSCFDVPEFSGPSGRRLALVSFCANIALSGGLSPSSLRATNLGLHVLNGVLVLVFIRQIGRLASVRNPELVAALIATLWLILPVHASVVPYVIQRMTILSATFSLTSLIAYLNIRDQQTPTSRNIWIIVCCLAALAAYFCKETGALVPVYVLLLWMTFRERSHSRQASVAPTALVGTIAALASLFLWQEWTSVAALTDYSGRDFTMRERLLTQPRAIWYYVSEILVPHTGDIGLFQDDFVLSRSLLSPPSTVPAIIALAVWPLALLRCRRLLRFAGFFFLVGHLLESTVFPLELVFLHRNYLPSLGLIMAAILLVEDKGPLLRWATYIALFSLFCTVTAWRATNWASEARALESSYYYHPASRRAASEYAQYLSRTGNHMQASDVLARTAAIAPSRSLTLSLQQIYVYCQRDGHVPESLVASLGGGKPFPQPQELNQALENVLVLVRERKCMALNMDQFRAAVSRIFDTQISSGLATKWDLQYFLAATYFASHDEKAGVEYLEELLRKGEVRAGYYLIDIWLSSGKPEQAQRTLDAIRQGVGTRESQDTLEELRQRIATAKGSMGQ